MLSDRATQILSLCSIFKNRKIIIRFHSNPYHVGGEVKVGCN